MFNLFLLWFILVFYTSKRLIPKSTKHKNQNCSKSHFFRSVHVEQQPQLHHFKMSSFTFVSKQMKFVKNKLSKSITICAIHKACFLQQLTANNGLCQHKKKKTQFNICSCWDIISKDFLIIQSKSRIDLKDWVQCVEKPHNVSINDDNELSSTGWLCPNTKGKVSLSSRSGGSED